MTRLSYATGRTLNIQFSIPPGRRRVRNESEDLPSQNFTALPAGSRAAAGLKIYETNIPSHSLGLHSGMRAGGFCTTSGDSTAVHRKDNSLDSTQVIKESIIIGTPAGYKYREVIPAQTLKEEEQFQRLNSFSVADAIRYFSGVQLKDYGGVGGLKTVNIRSMGTNHMAVFYDGIQLGNAQNGQVDWAVSHWTMWRRFPCTTGRKATSSSQPRTSGHREQSTSRPGGRGSRIVGTRTSRPR